MKMYDLHEHEVLHEELLETKVGLYVWIAG